jgi:Tol biopolymer transport system component
LAAPFDVEALELTGAAVPVAEGLAVETNGTGFLAVSETGTLAYLTGAVGVSVTPVWVERDGTAREVDPGWRTPGNPTFPSLALSPNEDRLAISILDSEGTWDLWVKQLDTGPLSRLTFEGPQNRRATWSPDGQSLTFISTRAGRGDLWTKRADGSDSTDIVLDRPRRGVGGVLLS